MSKRPRRTHARNAQAHPSTSTPGEPQPDGAGHRQARLETILLEELQSLVNDASDPSLQGVSLLSVHLSPDGSDARIAYAVRAPVQLEQERRRTSQTGLARATGFLRAQLAQHLNPKKLPKLTFTFVGTSGEGGSSAPDGGEPCPE